MIKASIYGIPPTLKFYFYDIAIILLKIMLYITSDRLCFIDFNMCLISVIGISHISAPLISINADLLDNREIVQFILKMNNCVCFLLLATLYDYFT